MMVKDGTKKGCFARGVLWQRAIITYETIGPAVFEEIVSGRAVAEIAHRYSGSLGSEANKKVDLCERKRTCSLYMQSCPNTRAF